MKEARFGHASCSMSDQIFVFGGSGTSSIECHDVDGSNMWNTIIDRCSLVSRVFPAVAPMDQTKIVVFGGAQCKTGYVLNTSTNMVSEILGADTDLEFMCFTQVQRFSDHSFVTVGPVGGEFHKIKLSINY